MASLRFEVDGDVRRIVLDNPPQNRIGVDMGDALARAVDEIQLRRGSFVSPAEFYEGLPDVYRYAINRMWKIESRCSSCTDVRHEVFTLWRRLQHPKASRDWPDRDRAPAFCRTVHAPMSFARPSA